MDGQIDGWVDFPQGTSSGLTFALKLFPYVSVSYGQHLSSFMWVCPAYLSDLGFPRMETRSPVTNQSVQKLPKRRTGSLPPTRLVGATRVLGLGWSPVLPAELPFCVLRSLCTHTVVEGPKEEAW